MGYSARHPVSLVHFRTIQNLPLPGLPGVQLFTLETPGHGLYLGTLQMWVHLDTRVVELLMESGAHQSRVWVPFEHVSSYVLDSSTK